MFLNFAACALFVGITLLSLAKDPSPLRPTALFGIIWALIIASATLIPFGTLSLKPEAISVFVVGGIAFALAGEVADLAIGDGVFAPPSPTVMRTIQRAALAYNMALLLLVPVFISVLLQAMDTLQLDDFAVAARFALGPERERLQIPHYFQSFTSLGAILALATAWTYQGSRADRIALALSIPGPLAMSVLTFARSPVVSLLVSVAMVLAIRGRVSRRSLLTGVCLTLVLALVMGSLLSKGPDLDAVASPAQGFARSMGLYFGGGALGFSAAMDQPYRVTEPGLAYTFITQLANWFGLVKTLPDPILGDVTAELGNVYTFYFSYWADAGWIGVILGASAAGFATNTLYLLARRQSLLACVAFGVAAQTLFLQGTADPLFGSSVPWLLIFFVIGGLQLGARMLDGMRARRQREPFDLDDASAVK